jgi:hypothetical protein
MNGGTKCLGRYFQSYGACVGAYLSFRLFYCLGWRIEMAKEHVHTHTRIDYGVEGGHVWTAWWSGKSKETGHGTIEVSRYERSKV